MDAFRSLIKKSMEWLFSYAPPQLSLDLEQVRQASSVAVLEPLLSNRSGYVREAAALRASELLQPTLLPLLMPRINDWVPQVRLAARKSVEAYLRADRFDAVLSALPSIYRLKDCGREDHTDFIVRIEKFIIEHPRSKEIPGSLAKHHAVVARCLFDLSWKYEFASKHDLIRIGLALDDVLTVRRACRAIEQLQDSEQLAFGRQLLGLRSGWLRYDGLRIVHRHDSAAAKQAAFNCLLAEYAPLRELAEKLSHQTPEELSLLRQKVLLNKQSDNATIRTAIKLSGALKDKNCLKMLEGYLEHQSPTFRGYALLALSRISPGNYNEQILAFLGDETPVVSRCAVQAVIENGIRPTPAQWEEFVLNTQTIGHFQRLSALARRMNKWEHLGVLLAYCALGKFSELTKVQLNAWQVHYNHSFVNASSDQMGWIKENLKKYTGQSPSADTIGFYLS